MDKSDILQFAAEEADQRPIRYTEVPITDYTPPKGVRGLCRPGSITLFFARANDSEIVDQIASAAERSDSRETSELVDRIDALYRDRTPLNYNRAWRLLRRQPFFVDIRCGPRTLATNMFIPEDLPLGVISFPHNGGRIPADSLTLVEHLRADLDQFPEEAAHSFRCVALRDPGPLTEIEQAALAAVPADQLELNIAPHAGCCQDYTGVALLLMMTLVLAEVERPIEQLPETRIRNLSSDASARELMEIRREALGHPH